MTTQQTEVMRAAKCLLDKLDNIGCITQQGREGPPWFIVDHSTAEPEVGHPGDLIEEVQENPGKALQRARIEVLQAALASRVMPDGYKLVPIEPTEAMFMAACGSKNGIYNLDYADDLEVDTGEIYRSMLAAAPPNN